MPLLFRRRKQNTETAGPPAEPRHVVAWTRKGFAVSVIGIPVVLGLYCGTAFIEVRETSFLEGGSDSNLLHTLIPITLTACFFLITRRMISKNKSWRVYADNLQHSYAFVVMFITLVLVNVLVYGTANYFSLSPIVIGRLSGSALFYAILALAAYWCVRKWQSHKNRGRDLNQDEVSS